MEERELEQLRNRSQTVTNILKKDFDFKWGGVDYTVKKWETETYPFYLAEHCALHMSRKYFEDNIKDFHKKGGQIVDKIMGKEFIEYNNLTIKEAEELCEKRKISLDIEWKAKNKAKLIQDLKDSH